MNNAEVLIKFKGDTANVSKSIDGLKSKIGGLASGIAKGIGVATATATTALIGIGKKAVENFAEHEQLIGGVETLFKDSASKVMNYANKAYETAGISANKYMEQATSFSARLLKDTGGNTEKVADLIDMAIKDMADNANKMGTPMENIQNAYEALAKGNATLLDNLKVGYGGTKTELMKLAKEMGVVDKNIKSFDEISFEDAIMAIHKVQEQLEITGTTSTEASTTIQGSLNMTKASFQDFLTSLAKGDNIDSALDNLINSAMTFGDNIMPIIEKVVNSIASALPKIINKVVAILPGLIKKTLPSLIKGAVALVNGLIQALPMLIETLLPYLITGLIEITNQIIAMLPEIVLMITDMLPVIIPQLVDGIMQIIPALMEHLPEFLQAGFQLLVGIVSGLISALPKIFDFGIKFVGKLFDGIKSVVHKIPEFFESIWNRIWEGISNFLDGVKQFFKNAFDTIISIVKAPINFLIDGINLFIRGLNKIRIPDWVPGIGGAGIHINEIAHLDTGTNRVPEDMLAMIHKGEAVVPKKFNPYANGINTQTMGAMQNSSQKQIINVYVESNTDPLGQVVNSIKTFGGGAKNDYNYGYGGM